MTGIDSFSGAYAFLSNFYPSLVLIDSGGNDLEWVECATVEHAFQAEKSLDPDERRRIAHAPSPGRAKRLGRRVANLRPEWDRVRDDYMRALLVQKFGSRHPTLAHRLLDTGDAELIEGNTWGDCYWGVCDGRGENRLGQLLMERRTELRS